MAWGLVEDAAPWELRSRYELPNSHLLLLLLQQPQDPCSPLLPRSLRRLLALRLRRGGGVGHPSGGFLQRRGGPLEIGVLSVSISIEPTNLGWVVVNDQEI